MQQTTSHGLSLVAWSVTKSGGALAVKHLGKGVLGGGSVPTHTPWDGRSLVGRLHPPLKEGAPLHTPPLINIPSLSAKLSLSHALALKLALFHALSVSVAL